MAMGLAEGDDRQVHFAYKDLERGRPDSLPVGFSNIVSLDWRSRDRQSVAATADYVATKQIRTVFAFDAPVSIPAYSALRRSGVRTIVSYYGAPMSSLNSGLKLLMKRAEVRMRKAQPDHYIFESEAMRETGIQGRGLSHSRTSVVYLGVDGQKFKPQPRGYAHQVFGIPNGRKVVVYSGHMEPRKGVHVLIKAFLDLVILRNRRDLHLLVLGDKPGQSVEFRRMYEGTAAQNFITFGGYRNDIDQIFGTADIGAIASTGWDSFTMSSVEMAASGLPLVVSRLQGLTETIEEGVTGFGFPPGNSIALADRVVQLAEEDGLRRSMGAAARARALSRHSVDRQIDALIDIVRHVQGRKR